MMVEMLVRRVVDGRVTTSVEMVDTHGPQRETRQHLEQTRRDTRLPHQRVEVGRRRVLVGR